MAKDLCLTPDLRLGVFFRHAGNPIQYPDGSTWRARYDDKVNLLAEFDALGQMTEYSTATTACRTPSSMRPTSPSACGGTPWPRSSVIRIARARARTPLPRASAPGSDDRCAEPDHHPGAQAGR